MKIKLRHFILTPYQNKDAKLILQGRPKPEMMQPLTVEIA
jgi:hypothetical protein